MVIDSTPSPADKKVIKPHSYPVIIAKLDLKRCCCRLSDFKMRKTTIKEAKPYRLTVNTAWDRVIEGIWDRHGVNWVFPSLANAYKQLIPPSSYLTRMYSIELWYGDELAAGEIGYTCGGSYTSLSGYFVKKFPGAGRVQLTALGCLLRKCGFDLWDWGMFMEYKVPYGASKYSRELFFDLYHQNLRLSPIPLEIYITEQPNQADLIIT